MLQMTTRKSIVTPQLPTDLVQSTSNINRSAAIESAVLRLQTEGVVAVVGRSLQARLSKGEPAEGGAKVTASIKSEVVEYLRDISSKTGLSTNQLITYALEYLLFEEP